MTKVRNDQSTQSANNREILIMRRPDVSVDCNSSLRSPSPNSQRLIARGGAPRCVLSEDITSMRNQFVRNRKITQFMECLRSGNRPLESRKEIITILAESLMFSTEGSRSKMGAIVPAASLLLLNVGQFNSVTVEISVRRNGEDHILEKTFTGKELEQKAIEALKEALNGDCHICQRMAKESLDDVIMFGRNKNKSIKRAFRISIPNEH